MKNLFIVLLLASCSVYKPKPTELSSDLKTYEFNYVHMVQSIQDEFGFIDTDKCDSLAHTGLIAIHPQIDVDLEAAEISDGEWLRRPVTYKECHKSGESRSKISRDGLLSVIYAAYVNKDLAMLERMWEYGASNNWVMGSTLHSVMNPNMISLLAQAIHKLGGADHYISRQIPVLPLYNCKGYECHLSMVQIALFGELNGKIYEHHLDFLKKLEKKNPKNILVKTIIHKYTDGDFSSIERLIKAKYPLYRLPNRRDWCDDWPTQRDDNDPNLKPCKGEKPHSAGELIFVFGLMK